MRKRRIPPNELKGESLISYLEDSGVEGDGSISTSINISHSGVHMSRYDSMGIARDLIMFEKNSSGKVNGVPENLQPCVLTAYKEFKNNPSKLDEYEKLDRTIRST